MTTHAAQGVTADHAVVLAGGSMQSLESTYVQMSRMRYSTEIITTRQAIADQAAENGIDLPLDEPNRDPLDDLKDLIEQMERSDQKDTTLDYDPEPDQEQTNGLDQAAALDERDQDDSTMLQQMAGRVEVDQNMSVAEAAVAGPEME